MRRAAAWILLLLLAPLAAFAQVSQSSDPPLTVESLECRGNVTTSCRFILGHLYLSEGGRLDEEEIQNAKLRLQYVRNFSSVSIYLEKGSRRGLAKVVVEVVEANAVSKEATLGLFSKNGAVGQLVEARWTENNLFGNGKVLDFRASLVTPLAGDVVRERIAQLSYVDPHLFDSKRYYFSSDIAYLDSNTDRENGDRIDLNQLALDLNFGRRLWDFSYFTAGFQYRPVSDRYWRLRQNDDGDFETTRDTTHASLIVAYGWNSRDNQYFPTRGSAFQAALATTHGRNDADGNVSYSNTWTSSNGNTWIASFSMPELSTRIELQRPLKPFLDSQHARAFVQLGIGNAGFSERGGHILTGGFGAGVRFDSRRFGIVTFWIVGQTSWNK